MIELLSECNILLSLILLLNKDMLNVSTVLLHYTLKVMTPLVDTLTYKSLRKCTALWSNDLFSCLSSLVMVVLKKLRCKCQSQQQLTAIHSMDSFFGPACMSLLLWLFSKYNPC